MKRVDLILVGARGMAGIEKFILGGVATRDSSVVRNVQFLQFDDTLNCSRRL